MKIKNLIVIELASVLAGPSVGQFFAELGAEVIKVENSEVGGDVTRSWLFNGEAPDGNVSSYFSSVNWGKKSITLDLRSTEDRKKLYKLVKKADIIITSYKAGDAEKLGVGYEKLSAINPQIIYGQIIGYSNSSKVGYDAVVQAETGFMSMNGEKGSSPLKMPVALIDVLAAHQLKEAVLVAIIERMATGHGKHLRVSLMDAAISALVNQGSNWLVGKKAPKAIGNLHPNIAPYGELFTTKDDRQLLLAVGNNKQFYSLSKVLGLDLMIEDFSTNLFRLKHRGELNLLIGEKIKDHHSGELLSKLNKHQIPAGLVATVDQVLENGEAHWFFKSGQIQGLRSFVASGIGQLQLSPPPQLGQHNDEILSSL